MTLTIRRLPSESLFAVFTVQERKYRLNISGKKLFTLILYIRIHRIELLMLHRYIDKVTSIFP